MRSGAYDGLRELALRDALLAVRQKGCGGGDDSEAEAERSSRPKLATRKRHRDAASGSNMLEKLGTLAAWDSCSGVTRYVSHRCSAG